MKSHPLVKLFYQYPTTREAYQKIRLNVNISWEPGSQVPREFAALGITLIWHLIGMLSENDSMKMIVYDTYMGEVTYQRVFAYNTF